MTGVGALTNVTIYDTTLRDGAQGEGISFTIADKIDMVRRLDALGVDYIEGGWPGSNARDLAFFAQLKTLPLRHSKVVAFTSTRRKNQVIQDDDHMRSVLGTGMKHCAVVGKTWDFHVHTALRTTLEENLSMITDTIRFLKEHDIEALFDAEHFFDGYKRNPEYAQQALRAAWDAGADWLILCDTNGGSLPHEIHRIVSEVIAAGFDRVGIHAHNDGGLAVANSLAAVEAGATQVQGTINGFGERCGNTDLCVALPNLVLKMDGVRCHIQPSHLTDLKALSERVYGMTHKPTVSNQPFVGRSAFTHKAGIHVSAVVRDPSLYEHINPAAVGNERRVLLSELSGESNVVYQLQRFGLVANPDAPGRILRRLKAAEFAGYTFDSAEASMELLMRDELGVLPVAPARELDAVVESVNTGYSARVQWVEGAGDRRHGIGHGVSKAKAVCQALSRFTSDVQLVHEQVTPVSILTDSSGSAPQNVYRTLLTADVHGETACTVGIGRDELASVLAAVSDLIHYIALKQSLAQSQQNYPARAVE